MAVLPTGTVTFLLTDIEGSTTLLQRLGAGQGRHWRRFSPARAGASGWRTASIWAALACAGDAFQPSRPAVKRFHFLDDVGQGIFDGEVAGIQPMHLRVRKIHQIGFAALAREEDIVLSPENDCLGLLLSEERLPLRVELYVCAVVIEKVELHSSRVGPIEIMQIHVPVVRANKLGSGMAVCVDQLDSVGL